ncbi:hypothetical protein F4780DRAFT_171750 [Xylariomycetidae sp. FL0641]|nr:hypothetical protein F4780DRAFT_171750 [Xylariomycetidae sp. FL0641]
MAADNGAAFSGSLWTVVVVSGIFVALRGGAKVSRKRNLRSDDYIMFVAWLLLFIASTLMQRAVALGFGRNKAELSHAHQWDISTFAVIYSATLTIVVSLARISFAISLLRCTTGWSKVVVWTMIVGLVCITMVPLVVTRFTICTPFQKVYGVEAEGHCGNTWIPLYIGWASGAWSAFSDFVLLVVAWSIVWVMKKERREKIGIAIALSFGIISGALTVFRYVYVALIYAQDFYQYGYLGFLWVSIHCPAREL